MCSLENFSQSWGGGCLFLGQKHLFLSIFRFFRVFSSFSKDHHETIQKSVDASGQKLGFLEKSRKSRIDISKKNDTVFSPLNLVVQWNILK